MKFSSKVSVFAILLTMACATFVQAHSLWLETPAAVPVASEKLDVNIGFNEGFEVVEILKNSVELIPAPTMEGKAGTVNFSLKSDGPNYAYASDKPVDKGSYMAFATYKPFVMKHGEAKNNYIMTAKHLVNVANGDDTEIVTKAFGKAKLEIVPLANPSSIKAGEILPVQVLFEGKPLVRTELLGDFRGFNPAGSWGLAKAFYCKTNKEGKLDFIPAKGGLWILKARHEVPNEDKTEAAATVYLSTFTFFVKE